MNFFRAVTVILATITLAILFVPLIILMYIGEAADALGNKLCYWAEISRK